MKMKPYVLSSLVPSNIGHMYISRMDNYSDINLHSDKDSQI